MSCQHGTPNGDNEYFDVLDPVTFVSTGQKKARSLVHRDGDWHSSVHLWYVLRPADVKTNALHVLIQLRSEAKDSWPLHWDVSCAGHVSAGETPYEALIQECKEELGVDLKDDHIVHLCSMPRRVCSEQKKGLFVDNELTHVYMCVTNNADLTQFTLQKEEVVQLKWINLREYIERLQHKHNENYYSSILSDTLERKEYDNNINTEPSTFETSIQMQYPFVPFPDIHTYNQLVFDVILQKYSLPQTSSG